MGKLLRAEQGQVFGEFTIVNGVRIIDKDGRSCYLCRCVCGAEQVVRISKLVSTDNVACYTCTKKRVYNTCTKASWDVSRTKYVGDISGTLFSHIRQCARTRGIAFLVTKEQLWDLLVEQEFKCALTGVDIQLSLERKKSDPDFSKITASLDRIDSSGDYTIDNVQWLHKDVNKMKWTMSNQQFIAICRDVVNKHGNTEPSTGNFDSTVKVQRIGSEPEEGDKLPTKNGHPTGDRG